MSASSLAAANPRAAQARIEFGTPSKASGQRAHDLRQGPQPDYVDASRTHLNRILIEPITGAQLKAICVQRRSLRDARRAMKSNASAGIAGILTFGHDAQKLFERLTPDQQDAAYREAAEAVAERLGTTLTGLVVHADESAPHAHFQCPAYDHAGQAISETTKKSTLSGLQTLVAEIMARHAPGIERGHPKRARLKAGAKPSEVVHKSVRQLHDELPLEIAKREEELEALRQEREGLLQEIDRQSKRAEDARAKAERLKAQEDRAAQAIKTAGVYEARAEKARTAADLLEAQIAEKTARLEAKRKEVADQEEVLKTGEEILAQVTEEIEEQSKTLEDLKGQEEVLEAQFGVFREKNAALASVAAKIDAAFTLALHGQFETPLSVEDLAKEGMSQGEAAQLHEAVHRTVHPRPVTKGWRLYHEALEAHKKAATPKEGNVFRRRGGSEAETELQDLFYQARGLCRHVRREGEARAGLDRSLAKQREKAEADLAAERSRVLAEARQEARGEVEAAWKVEVEGKLAMLGSELAVERGKLLEQARAEAKTLEASLLSDGGRELKELRTENARLTLVARTWTAFQDVARATLKSFLGEERYAAFQTVFRKAWGEHPENPERLKPEPPRPPRSSGPSGP